MFLVWGITAIYCHNDFPFLTKFLLLRRLTGMSFSSFFLKGKIMTSPKKKSSDKEKRPKGVPIPAGTEQETGLTRAQTEKPKTKPRPAKRDDLSRKQS